MIKDFIEFNHQHKLFSPADRILLALSGGIDSVVMAHLFHELGMSCGVAHCNFKLRGTESDEDEDFVRKLASSLDFSIHVEHFDTESYAAKNKVTIQMAARELRYDYFHRLVIEHGYDKIALAHHRNDQIETFLMNLGRGSGLRGLRGMPVSSETIIRPLLFSTRQQIETFASTKHLHWREDSSNSETHYLRNKIRHELLPMLNQTLPGFDRNTSKSVELLSEAYDLQQFFLESWKEKIIREIDSIQTLQFDILPKEQKLQLAILKELLRHFGFTAMEAESAYLQSQGGRITGSLWIAEKGINCIYLLPKELVTQPTPRIIEKGWQGLLEDYHLKFSILPWNPNERPDPDPGLAFLDISKLNFPLTVRCWIEGDRIMPLGMTRHKLLSDLFGEMGVPVHMRTMTPVVMSGDSISWVAGLRISELFKVDPATTQVLKIEYIK